MDDRPLTIGVHTAGLARAQAERVAHALSSGRLHYPVHLEIVAEVESVISLLHDDHIAENRSKIKRLHGLLREGAIDIVIHHGFDLRGEVPDDLCVVAVLERNNPYDVLLSPFDKTLDELEEGDRVGVVHLRARAQILDHRPELDIEIINGDAGDWLTVLIDGRVDALVAPGAAIEHLSLQERVCEIFPTDLLVPAPGSGVLLCLARADDALTAKRLRRLHHPTTANEYAAECALLESLGGPWELPIGALARLYEDHMEIHAMVAAPDGSIVLREEHFGGPDDPCLAGAEAAALLLSRDADRLLEGSEPSDEDFPCSIAGELPGLDAEWEEETD